MQIDAGKTAEYVVASELLSRNLVPLWPSTAHIKYDMAVFIRPGKAIKIQVKGSHRANYKLRIQISSRPYKSSRMRAYTKDDTDLIIIHLFHYNLTYIIPVEKLRGLTKITLTPLGDHCPWRGFKDNWRPLGIS